MKIIFSRKGFDNASGGFPSLIFPNTQCFSIPIPGKLNKIKYSDLNFEYEEDTIQKILNNITHEHIKVKGNKKRCDYSQIKFHCHNDPMIIHTDSYKGMALGQSGAALGHLEKQGVKKGDLFLFYGLFQDIEKSENAWRYKKDSKPVHLIYACMKIDEVISVDSRENIIKKYPFLKNHPHLDEEFMIKEKKSKIYIGEEFQIFNFAKKRVLTNLDRYSGVANWKIPLDFDFSSEISYIKSVDIENGFAYLSHRGYGQEFVFNIDKLSSKNKGKVLEYLNKILK